MAPIETDVWQGEIAELEVDAIVVPASESLFMTSGVAAAVKLRAGESVERDAVRQGPISAGNAVVTGGGLLAAPYVIHAVAVGHDLRRDPEQLRAAFVAALRAVEHLQLRRIAVAPLGTERGVFSPVESATIMSEVLAEHAERATFPEAVVFAQSGPVDSSAVRVVVERGRGAPR